MRIPFFFCVLQKPLWNQPFLFSNIGMKNKHDWPLNSLHHKGKWTWKEKIKLILAWRQWFQKIEEIDTFCISWIYFIHKQIGLSKNGAEHSDMLRWIFKIAHFRIKHFEMFQFIQEMPELVAEWLATLKLTWK